VRSSRHKVNDVRRFVVRSIALAAFAAAVLALAGCTFHPDPTEATFYVKVVNDTSRTVILSICGTDDDLCAKVYETGRVKAGGSWPSVETSVGSVNPVLVRTVSGKRLGCLPLFFDYNADGIAVRVSEIVPCTKHYTARSQPG
jgi:hypothetical protein